MVSIILTADTMKNISLLHASRSYLSLSVETLCLAHVIHDALDVAMAHWEGSSDLDDARLQELRLSSEAFERLGDMGCSATPVTPLSSDWTPASRIELIRQVAVHWRALINTSFGTPVSRALIQALSDEEVLLLEQIQNFSHKLLMNGAAILFDMQQACDSLARRQAALKAQRCATYLASMDQGIDAGVQAGPSVAQ